MWRLLLIPLLASVCWAQGTDPRFIQSRSVAGSGVCDFKSNVTSGDVIVVNSSWFTGTFSSISDTRSTSFTAATGFPFTGGGLTMGMWVGTLGSSGSDTVTVTVTAAADQNIQCIQFRNVTATGDGTPAVAAFSGTPASASSGNMTTVANRSLLIGAAAGFRSAGVFKPTGSFIGAGWSNGDDSAATSFKIAGAAGTYAATFSNATNDTGIVGIIALKSATSAAVTSPTALPDGALSQAYDYTLTAVSGASPDNWTITSGVLQNGLTLTAGTGRISGTPTSSSNATLVVTPDGGTTNKTVTLKIAGSLNTIAHVQDSSNLENGVFPGNVTSGNLVVLGLRIEPGSSFAIPTCTDTLLTDYFFIGNVLMGNGSFGEARYPLLYAGIAPSTGANTVTCAANGQLTAAEFSNTQLFIDNSNTTAGSGGATYTSTSLTTLVPNELLTAMAAGYTSSTVLVTNAPFTNVPRSHTTGSEDWDLATTVTTYTASYGASGNTDGQWGIVLAGFRPTTGAIVVTTAHPKAQVY